MSETRPLLPWWRRVAPMSAALFVANLAMFILCELAGGSEDPTVLALYGAKATSLVESGQWWRVVSSSFLHIGPLHLIINGYALLLLGSFVERAYGSRRLLAVYAGAATAGGIASALFSPALSAGASGAVYGLFGVALLFAYRNRYRLSPAAQRTYWVWLLPFFMASVAFGFLFPVVDNWAHLGGLFGGVLVALAFGNPAAAPAVPVRARELAATLCAVVGAAVLLLPQGLALGYAVRGELWPPGAPTVVLMDESVGLRVTLPATWAEFPERSADVRTFSDGVGCLLSMQILPGVIGEADTLAHAQRESKEGGRARLSRRILRAAEKVSVGGKGAVEVVMELIDGAAVRRRQLYYLAGEGRSVALLFDMRPQAQARYESVVHRIVSSVVMDDGAPLARAWAELAAKNTAAAVAHLTAALAQEGGPLATNAARRAYALATLAKAHLTLGERDRAAQLAVDLGKLPDTDLRVRLSRVELLVALGEGMQARQLVRAAQDGARGDRVILEELAQKCIELKLEREAISIYEDLTHAEPKPYTAFNNLGWLLATSEDPALRDPPRAVRQAQVAVEGTSWQEGGFIDTLAQAQFAAGRAVEAIATLERALTLEPQSTYLLGQRAKFQAGVAVPPGRMAARVDAPAAKDGGAADAGSNAAGAIADGGAQPVAPSLPGQPADGG